VQHDLFLEFGPLVPAYFLARPNRFLVHCQLEQSGELVEAHLADPGRLKELLLPGALLYLRRSTNPKRRTKWSVMLIQAPGPVLVSLQSTLVNQLAARALAQKAIPALAPWDLVRAEYAYGGSRFDFLLENGRGERLLLEVKSCTLVQDGTAMFPDAVTARGAKHVLKLAELQKEGAFRGGVLFVVQRSDAVVFRPASHIDPKFAQALSAAHRAGVYVAAYNSRVEERCITWGQELPVQLV